VQQVGRDMQTTVGRSLIQAWCWIRNIQQMGELLAYMKRHSICNRNDFEKRIEDITAANEDKNLGYLLMIIELFEA